MKVDNIQTHITIQEGKELYTQKTSRRRRQSEENPALTGPVIHPLVILVLLVCTQLHMYES